MTNYYFSGTWCPCRQRSALGDRLRESQDQLAQSFEGAHRGRVCVRVFIEMSIYVCISIYVWTMFKKKVRGRGEWRITSLCARRSGKEPTDAVSSVLDRNMCRPARPWSGACGCCPFLHYWCEHLCCKCLGWHVWKIVVLLKMLNLSFPMRTCLSLGMQWYHGRRLCSYWWCSECTCSFRWYAKQWRHSTLINYITLVNVLTGIPCMIS
jgi:hypothetical protein